MVVFTCNHCGDSLQKPKVEKHYNYVCKTIKSLTCVDCFKDFRGEEYVVHTKCLTEDERYAAKGTYVNGIIKKGEVKQESWIEMIKSILDKDTKMKPSCRTLMNTISNYSNVPRKKNKFLNFIKSTTGGRVNMKDVEEVWNIIESHKMSQSTNTEHLVNKKSETPGESFNNSFDTEKELKNEENIRKRKMDSEENKPQEVVKKKKKNGVDNNTLITSNGDGIKEEIKKFRFQDVILNILSTRGSISLKKLQKKAINAYLRDTGESEVTEKIIKKFNKKLNKLPEVEINDNIVALKTVN